MNTEKQVEWDEYFLGMAQYASRKSKDPSTKVGAVVVRPDNSHASTGFNGFPRGVDDDRKLLNEREDKYKRIIHAEMNSLNFLREPADGYTLYVWPIPPCSVCAGNIIQRGIVRVVSPAPSGRWVCSCSTGKEMFKQSGVEVVEYSKDNYL